MDEDRLTETDPSTSTFITSSSPPPPQRFRIRLRRPRGLPTVLRSPDPHRRPRPERETTLFLRLRDGPGAPSLGTVASLAENEAPAAWSASARGGVHLGGRAGYPRLRGLGRVPRPVRGRPGLRRRRRAVSGRQERGGRPAGGPPGGGPGPGRRAGAGGAVVARPSCRLQQGGPGRRRRPARLHPQAPGAGGGGRAGRGWRHARSAGRGRRGRCRRLPRAGAARQALHL